MTPKWRCRSGSYRSRWTATRASRASSGRYSIRRNSCSTTRLGDAEMWGRRDFVRVGSLGMLGLNLADYFRIPAADAKDRWCILIWLSGGPPQTDLWDMKPDAPVEFRGTFKPIPTNASGIQLSEVLPLTAKVADKFTIIRSLTGREGEHEQAMTHMLTGNRPLATLSFPSMGAVVAKEKGDANGVPPYVAVPAPGYAYGPGFLGSAYAPFASGDASLANYKVRDIQLPTDVDWQQISDRRHLVNQMDAISERNPLLRNADTKGEFRAIDQAYEKAIALMTSAKAKKAFQISEEPARLRDRYGRT